jgi:hypothetical protein
MLEDEWFKKGYKRAEFDEKYDTTSDDVDAVFNDSEVSPWLYANHAVFHFCFYLMQKSLPHGFIFTYQFYACGLTSSRSTM